MMQESEPLLLLLKYVVYPQGVRGKLIPCITWNEVFTLSNQQGITAVAIDGLQAYLSTHTKEKPFANESSTDKLKRVQWLSQVMTCEGMYAKHEKAMAHLARVLAKQNIRMMVLKGYGLSLDWPVPNHRAVGDLDIYNFG